jgi:hypothetical protein
VFRRPLRVAAAVALAVLVVAPVGAAQAPRVAEVQLAPPFVKMVPDAQVQASATAYDSNGTPVVVRFRWSSSNINVATVTENGLVKGIAPGTALITATYEGQRSGRRRAMQVQVRSLGGSGTGVSVAPLPPATPSIGPSGAVPPVSAAPGAPPAPPNMVFVTPHAVDSMIKASINCHEPMISAANPLQACYDQRPTPRAPSLAALAPCPGLPGANSVLVMVRVSETGAPSEVMPLIRNGCELLIESAVAAARAMTFNPALREGRPVSAWVRMIIRNTESPPKQ